MLQAMELRHTDREDANFFRHLPIAFSSRVVSDLLVLRTYLQRQVPLKMSAMPLRLWSLSLAEACYRSGLALAYLSTHKSKMALCAHLSISCAFTEATSYEARRSWEGDRNITSDVR